MFGVIERSYGYTNDTPLLVDLLSFITVYILFNNVTKSRQSYIHKYYVTKNYLNKYKNGNVLKMFSNAKTMR